MKRFIFIFLGFWIFTSIAQDITRLEYFIDTDPGYGSGTTIPITPDSSVTTTFSMATSGISYGLHFLFVRAKDADGKWSETALTPVIIGEFINPGNLVQMEYFIDNDPGYGLATQRTVTPGKNISEAFNLNVSGLDNGLHQFFIRVKDEDGIWSIVQHNIFLTQDITMADIVKLEYFIDNDPGNGSGINVPVNQGEDVSKSFIIDLTGIAQGIHQLNVRAKDTENHWSLVHFSLFLAVDPAVPDIVQLEYFIDSDPGFGSGIQVPVTAGQDISRVLTMDTTGLSMGRHFLYLRAKNTRNNWSIIGYQEFSIFKTKLFLEGLYIPFAGMMNPAQNESGNQWGPGIADHVMLQIHDQNPPYNLVFEDESEIGTNGMAAIIIPLHLEQNYVAVRHRNSIETWSAAPVLIPALTTPYDFTASASMAYGDNLKDPGDGNYVIYGGEVEQDGLIDLSDMVLVEADINLFATGYIVSDVNGDGLVDLSDMVLVEQNINLFISSILP